MSDQRQSLEHWIIALCGVLKEAMEKNETKRSWESVLTSETLCSRFTDEESVNDVYPWAQCTL